MRRSNSSGLTQNIQRYCRRQVLLGIHRRSSYHKRILRNWLSLCSSRNTNQARNLIGRWGHTHSSR